MSEPEEIIEEVEKVETTVKPRKRGSTIAELKQDTELEHFKAQAENEKRLIEGRYIADIEMVRTRVDSLSSPIYKNTILKVLDRQDPRKDSPDFSYKFQRDELMGLETAGILEDIKTRADKVGSASFNKSQFSQLERLVSNKENLNEDKINQAKGVISYFTEELDKVGKAHLFEGVNPEVDYEKLNESDKYFFLNQKHVDTEIKKRHENLLKYGLN